MDRYLNLQRAYNFCELGLWLASVHRAMWRAVSIAMLGAILWATGSDARADHPATNANCMRFVPNALRIEYGYTLAPNVRKAYFFCTDTFNVPLPPVPADVTLADLRDPQKHWVAAAVLRACDFTSAIRHGRIDAVYYEEVPWPAR